MKDKLQKITQTFARSIIQPVMFMAVTGLLISVAAVMKLEQLPEGIKNVGTGLFTILTSAAINQLSVIFCVGIAAAIAKKKKTDAAILGITVFLIFIYANNFWLSQTGQLAKAGKQGLFGTGQNIVLGVQVTDMGVFLGIILGCLVGFFVNKLGDVKFHKYLSPYEGTKFAYVVLIFLTIIFAIAVSYIWPPINGAVNAIVGGLSGMGAFGFFLYGFLNRMLLPVGMHHLLWMPLYYTPLGGTAQVAGKTYNGAMNIWLAEIGNMSSVTSIHSSVGYLVNFGYIALPIGIAFALIHTAKPENRVKLQAILIPAVFASAFAGITEPIEFLFLFISPILWLAHGIIYGFGLFISNVLGLNMMVENIINTIMYSIAVPFGLGRQWLLIPIGLGLALLEYFVFKALIIKLNIPTLGRNGENELIPDELTKKTAKGAVQEKRSPAAPKPASDLAVIVKGLGGINNIENVNNCFTRLRIDVKDADKVDIATLKTYPSSGVVDKHKHIQIIIGLGVQDVREKLDDYLKENGWNLEPSDAAVQD